MAEAKNVDAKGGDLIPRVAWEEFPEGLKAALKPKVDRLGYCGEIWQVGANLPKSMLSFCNLTEDLKDEMPMKLVELTALTDTAIDDVVLPIAYAPGAADYLMGLGLKGGTRPAKVDWRWKVENHQEGVWMGGANRGLQYVLRDDNYVRPLNTNFYTLKPLVMRPSKARFATTRPLTGCSPPCRSCAT